ncbi:MAG: class I SAM-dependent methyltransferase, partial [Leptospiraceae bacterium]|nr:class I SAM-dependent methyltransferase [Leptospiraceae bacterium]
ANKGYSVHGVDRSEQMVREALERGKKLHETAHLAQQGRGSLQFSQGDIRDVRLGGTFDCVLSLFHVISYQTDNQSLENAFATARNHLESGGLFLFDVWYGPAVLTERPSVRIKRLHDETISVTRLAEPELHVERNVVDVNYELHMENLKTGEREKIRETHHMRYLFRPEIEYMLEKAGFVELLHSEEWLTGAEPGLNTWGVVFVARA